MSRSCPDCGGTDLEAEFVDIGVGEQQVTPYHCNTCGWQERNPYDDDELLDEGFDDDGEVFGDRQHGAPKCEGS